MRIQYILLLFVVGVCAMPTLTATLHPVNQSGAHGNVVWVFYPDHVDISGTVTGLTPGKHGFHIHEFGDCGGEGAHATGSHYNPHQQLHGKPSIDSHMGDLGNIEANEDGVATIQKNYSTFTQATMINMKGRSIVVHADADDLHTQPTGNAGAKVACGIIA